MTAPANDRTLHRDYLEFSACSVCMSIFFRNSEIASMYLPKSGFQRACPDPSKLTVLAFDKRLRYSSTSSSVRTDPSRCWRLVPRIIKTGHRTLDNSSQSATSPESAWMALTTAGETLSAEFLMTNSAHPGGYAGYFAGKSPM